MFNQGKPKLGMDMEDDIDEAAAAAAADESIYTHKTSTILDEEKVSFMHIGNLPEEENQSDEEYE